jgi:hypothetical protein
MRFPGLEIELKPLGKSPTFAEGAKMGHPRGSCATRRTKVQAPDQCPDRPRGMFFSNQAFHIHSAPLHLLPVHVADQRLAAHIFLAHAASLRHTSFFARMKFRRFLHSLETKGAAPTADDLNHTARMAYLAGINAKFH